MFLFFFLIILTLERFPFQPILLIVCYVSLSIFLFHFLVLDGHRLDKTIPWLFEHVNTLEINFCDKLHFNTETQFNLFGLCLRHSLLLSVWVSVFSQSSCPFWPVCRREHSKPIVLFDFMAISLNSLQTSTECQTQIELVLRCWRQFFIIAFENNTANCPLRKCSTQQCYICYICSMSRCNKLNTISNIMRAGKKNYVIWISWIRWFYFLNC